MDIAFGIVQTDPAPLDNDGPDGARYVEVDLQPDEGLVFARLANIGCGKGRGIYVDPKPGDEVLVIIPSVDRQGAVVLGGFNNTANPNPAENDSDRVLVLHGTEIRLQVGEAASPEAVVLESLLADLQTYVSTINQFLLAASTASVAPQVAAAAVTALQAVQAQNFEGKLSADYRAPNVKAGG